MKTSDPATMAPVNVNIRPELVPAIDELLRMGLHGSTRGEVVDRLVSAQIQQLIIDGYMAKSKVQYIVRRDHEFVIPTGKAANAELGPDQKKGIIRGHGF